MSPRRRLRPSIRGAALLGPLSRALHVRRSEMGRSFRMAGLAVVLGWGMYTAFNATQAIFLQSAGPSFYPLFFIALAVAVWPLLLVQNALSRRLGVGAALRLGMLVSAALGVGTYVAYRVSESPPVAIAAYLAYSVAFEVVTLLFWAFVAQFFNLLEAKRVYPVIAAGSSVGYILAGVTTSVVAGLWATEPLVLVWAGGCVLAAALVGEADRRLFRPSPQDDADDLQVETGPRDSLLKGAIHGLRTSRLVQAVAVMAVLLLIGVRLGDYLVAVIFVRATHGLAQLTVLLGDAWLASYVVQLALALLVAPPLLSRLGVKNAILVLPVAMAAGFAALLAAPGLPAALFLFIIRNGVQTGVDDPAQNTLSNALPEQIVPRLRLLLDVLVLPVGTLLAGIALVAAQELGAGALKVLAGAGIAVSVLLLIAALRVRGLYLDAVYTRLRHHAMSLGDFEQALGKLSPEEITEVEGHLADSDPEVSRFAAAALAKLAPERFEALAGSLAASGDPGVRRIALQLAKPSTFSRDLIESFARDKEPWVAAAAAVAGWNQHPRWEAAAPLLRKLRHSREAEAAAAGVWASALIGQEDEVLSALHDRRPRVRLEAIRSFAKLKADVKGAANPMIDCLRDRDAAVRREALEQAIRWAPPAGDLEHFAAALLEGLTSGDPTSRRLAGEALAIQVPAALDRALPLLNSRSEVSAATVEAFVRSGRPELGAKARAHLQGQLAGGLSAASLAGQLRALAARHAPGADDPRQVFLRLALEDYLGRVILTAVAYLRAQHGRRGFRRVERGLTSTGHARVEALETLLNFGPGWLAGPLVRLLEPESFEPANPRPLTGSEMRLLQDHPDRWVRQAAAAAARGLGERMKDLIALKRVPLFATLSLDQLASIDRLMITRRYLKGESICEWGDLTSEMYVVVEGEVRIHRDEGGMEVTLGRLGSSDYFGEMALFDNQPRSAGAQAGTDVTVRVLRKDRLEAIVHEHPEVLMQVIHSLSGRLRDANQRLEQAVRASAPGAAAGALEAGT